MSLPSKINILACGFLSTQERYSVYVHHHYPPLTMAGNDTVMVGSYTDASQYMNAIQERTMSEKKAVYKSFLIRICHDETQQLRRITVTRINEAEEQVCFLSLDDLMIFFLQEMETNGGKDNDK